jgi:peptidoglycan hydrolase-like protein with peptidoglycan-binding domain
MPSTISASVGSGGGNRNADVRIIQELLNRVPVSRGGPAAPLDVDGLCGPFTVNAIRNFQQRNGVLADGRVDVNGRTFQLLLTFDTGQPAGAPAAPAAAPAPPPAAPPPPVAAPSAPSSNASSLRQRIIEIANAMATPAPGKVSDLVTAVEPGTGRTVRAGWPYLKSFFDDAVSGWQPTHWNDKATLDGVKIPGKRIPQPGRSGISWCGIFATWVLIQAGMQVKWVLGKGIVPLQIKYARDPQPGDVAVLTGEEIHHCIVTANDGKTLQTVNGNSDNQSILIKPVPVSRVAYYYTVGS